MVNLVYKNYFEDQLGGNFLGKQLTLDSILYFARASAHQYLREFAAIPEFLEKMRLAFGESFAPETALSLARDWAKGDLTVPLIEILPAATLNGSYGGYASATHTIYLSEEFLRENTLSAVTSAILEEFGHSIDGLLNDSDSAGDEGQIFAALVQGMPLPESELQALKQENDFATIFIDGQEVQIEQGRVSDSGGFEGSYQVITLDTTGGGFANFSYEHYGIPDNFIIRYEGRNILETGFVGGRRTGTVQIPDGDSNQLEVLVATDNAGTAWVYTVETLAPGLNIQNAYVDVAGGSNQTATIKFPVILSEASDVEVTVNYFTLVGTAVDGITGNDRIDYRPITGTLTFAPGETRKEIEITALGDTPVNYGGNANFEIFARDIAYKNWTEGQDIDYDSSSTLSYGKDLGYRVDKFFSGGSDFQAAGITSDENFFVLISDPVNGEINKDSGEEKDRLLTDLEKFLGPGFGTSPAYVKASEVLNDLQAQDTSWTFATGTIYDQGKAPVLAIRGTASGQDAWDDTNPNGIGYAQFTGNRGNVNQWLQDVSHPQDTNVSFKPHITGHSLGGALTQWIAADYSSQGALGDIVTFNAPGISFADANSFAGAQKVSHYITSTDVVSMAGFRYISGQFILSNETFSTFNQIPVYGPHTHPVIVPSIVGGSSKPSGLSQGPNGSVNSLLFTYLPDPDYFVFLLAVSKIPILGPTVATALLTRGSAEAARTTIGAVLYNAVDTGKFAVEFAKASVQAAWNAAKVWSAAAWDAVTGWGEAAWGAVSNWTISAWNATTQWVGQAWDATKQWSSDAWDATKQWSSDAWDATKRWSGDAWNATKQWSSDAWDATKQWSSDAWNATTKWTSDAWDATTHWTANAWDTTTQWTSDAWNATTHWTASAWDATTHWLGGLLPFSSDLLAVAAVQDISINPQGSQINNPWEASLYWSPEAWEATTHWSDAAWQATTEWTMDVWQATTEWTPEAWLATTHFTDDIWQATTQLDSAAGDVILFGTSSSDNLSGGSGNDIIDGLEGNDVLDGGDDNDILRGGSGNDSLTGGTGSDNFAFGSPTEGVDTIEDFESSEGDRIVVSGTGFGGGLTLNATLTESEFVLGTSAADSDDRFIYDSATGNLFFDPDGTGDAPQQQIATLTGTPSLSAADIFVSGSSTTPTIKITAPAIDVSGTEVTIEWNAFDADSEATISLFYDTDNQGFDGVLIADGIAETDGQGSFVLNTANVPQEDYFIYAKIVDEKDSPVFSYSKGQVQLKPAEEADLSVIQTASATSVGLGETFTYTIQVTNNGLLTIRGVSLVETLPEEVTFTSASLTPSQQTDNIITFDLGDLVAGESKTIEISVVAPTLIAETITSRALVVSNTTDPNATNNVDSLSTEVTTPDLPDLAITRTDSSGAVNINNPYSYTLLVTNNGSAAATEVVLTERFPSTIDVISATSSSPGLQRNLVDIIEFQLNAGERVTLDIDARTIGSSLDSVLRLFNSTGTQLAVSDDNAAPGEPSSLDPYIDFTSSFAGTYYVGVSGYSNFSYNPFIDGSGASSSSSGNYTLEIKVGSGGSTNQIALGEPNNTIPQAVDSGLNSANPGTFIGTGFIRTDTNPITISNGVITANLGTLNIGESATVNLTLASIAAGNFISTTNATSNEADANPLNNLIVGRRTVNSITPTGIDLELNQIVNNLNPLIGGQVSLNLSLTNKGPGTATNIQVRDALPAGLGFVSAFADQGTYDSTTGIWDVGNMRDNISRTLTIIARVNGGQSLNNTAEVTAVFEADIDSIPNNNNPNEDDQASVLIDVQNVVPIAQANKTLTVLEDAAPTSLNISAPTDANGDPLTITVGTIPNATKGQIFLGNSLVQTGDTLNPQQLTSLVFVPVANANGAAGTYIYTVNDGQGGSSSQAVTLAITPVNDAPLAQDDAATTRHNTPITIAALANDSDLDGDSISLATFNTTSAEGGRVSLFNNGTPADLTDDQLIYTPAPGFTGSDSFGYTISDGKVASAASVFVTVEPSTSNPKPAGIAITPTSGLTTTESGGTASFSVLLNSQPTADVIIGLSSSDTTEGTLSISSLTFTAANWNIAQTVTVTGADDPIIDGNIAYSILTDPAVSTDANYNGFKAPDISLTNIDNDVRGSSRPKAPLGGPTPPPPPTNPISNRPITSVAAPESMVFGSSTPSNTFIQLPNISSNMLTNSNLFP